MKSDVDTTLYMSTVRSCAEDCANQDDFDNCTDHQYTTRGCLTRMCCNDEDLCNSARPGLSIFSRWSALLLAVFASFLVVLAS
nr:hypothetical protein BaRGS_031294 [Batillaria attramentaria]